MKSVCLIKESLLLAALAVALVGCPQNKVSDPQLTVPDAQGWPYPDSGPDGGGDIVGPGPCAGDQDCNAGYHCHPDRRICLQCWDGQSCPEGEACVMEKCVKVPPCTEGSCADGLHCDEASNLCVECTEDAHCAANQYCDNFLCKDKKPGCGPEQPCPEGLFCNGNGLCVDCVEDVNCPESSWCDISTGDCRPDICGVGEKLCLDNSVVMCLANGSGWDTPIPCQDGAQCVNGVCEGQNACVPGTTACLDRFTVRKCLDNGKDWELNVCTDGTICIEKDGQATCELCTEDCSFVTAGSCGLGTVCGAVCNQCLDGQACPLTDEVAAGEAVPCIDQCSCEGRECGPDGCGGYCGDCSLGFTCNAIGLCECTPDCQGRTCGNDGCGDNCGFCEAGSYCSDSGNCLPKTCLPGELACNGPERVVCDANGAGWTSLGVCPEGKYCLAGTCSPWVCVPGSTKCVGSNAVARCRDLGDGWLPAENCAAPTPVCSNGACVPEGCVPQCQNKQCGADSCGGFCGTCGAGKYCDNGACLNLCVPQCTGKVCGTDQCGGSCGTCGGNTFCSGGRCADRPGCGTIAKCMLEKCLDYSSSVGFNPACVQTCSEGASDSELAQANDVGWCVFQACAFVNLDFPSCMANALKNQCLKQWNTCIKCTPDCLGKTCGPDGCDGACGICQDGFACENYKCVQQCIPNCTGRVCGDNGCSGTCGVCKAGEECINGLCNGVCVPQCTGKQCGTDGCAGSCGTCAKGFNCENGLCKEICVPQCFGKQCGPNGCGGTCGTCSPGFSCENGLCREICIPQCSGRQCGPDGCNGSCGTCPKGWSCSATGKCSEICVPQCVNKKCGSDGCGGSCGTCPVGYSCNASGMCQQACVPQCSGKQCGPDGCGGQCGTCPTGYICSSLSQCKLSCTPKCSGRECGPDGCGNICGLCGPEEACITGVCETAWDCETLMNCSWECAQGDQACFDACWANASAAAKKQYMDMWGCILQVCGPDPADGCAGQALYGACKDSYYQCMSCTPACSGKQCGPDGCNGTCGTCPGTFKCDSFGYCICQPACTGKTCGANGCGGSCGECPTGYFCSSTGTCTCQPNCQGKQCGSDGCGGSCGTCPSGSTCGPTGRCVPVTPVCGDQRCDMAINENCFTCPIDCGKCYGPCCEMHPAPGCDDPNITACVCKNDPTCCMKEWTDRCVEEVKAFNCGSCGCVPQCFSADGTWRECGPDGCGGQCGVCAPGFLCTTSGFCKCAPSCANKACGDDGCGGSCGTCPSGSICSKNQCLQVCKPQCTGKQCGPDGCGGVCGSCATGLTCNSSGQCVCVPNCSGKKCGPDGCGGTCGECGALQVCTSSGQCTVQPFLCGNGSCDSWLFETCDSCPGDCGVCCGNGQCQPAYLETCFTCSKDCGACCGDGFCKAEHQETCSTCPKDCGPCKPVCGDGLCSKDLGETCSTCPLDCGVCPPVCGDKKCDVGNGENCFNCLMDCGECTGNCCMAHVDPDTDTSVGCNSRTVMQCVCDSMPECCMKGWFEECAMVAQERCGACQGDCCTAHEGYGCVDPQTTECLCGIMPECCGNIWSEECIMMMQDFGCGSCCVPNCKGKTCGADGCGGSCGSCPTGYTCSSQGTCVQSGLTCAQVASCAATCGYTADCMLACRDKGTTAGKQFFTELLMCLGQNCLFNPTPQCFMTALKGACVTQYKTCLMN